MESPGATNDEPLSPVGGMFLRPEMSQIINFSMRLKYPIDTDFIVALKTELANPYLAKHPRFSSLLVVDKGGREYWRQSQISFDNHTLIRHHYSVAAAAAANESEMEEEIINGYVSRLCVVNPRHR